MKIVGRTTRFKEDYRRHIAGTPLAAELAVLVELLANGNPLRSVYRDHPLKGPLAGCRDCHLRGDLVVIYQVAPSLVRFIRVGSHNELFG